MACWKNVNRILTLYLFLSPIYPSLSDYSLFWCDGHKRETEPVWWEHLQALGNNHVKLRFLFIYLFMCSFECWINSSSYESLPAGGLSFSLVLYFPIIPLPLSCNRPLLFFSFTSVHHRYCSFASSCSISTQPFCPLRPLYSFPFSLPHSLIFVFHFISFPFMLHLNLHSLSILQHSHTVQRYKDPCSLLIIESRCFQSHCNRCVKTTQPSAFTNINQKMHHSKDLTDSNALL